MSISWPVKFLHNLSGPKRSYLDTMGKNSIEHSLFLRHEISNQMKEENVYNVPMYCVAVFTWLIKCEVALQTAERMNSSRLNQEKCGTASTGIVKNTPQD